MPATTYSSLLSASKKQNKIRGQPYALVLVYIHNFSLLRNITVGLYHGRLSSFWVHVWHSSTAGHQTDYLR